MRPPGGWGRRAAKPANEVITDFGAAKPAILVITDPNGNPDTNPENLSTKGKAKPTSKPANEVITDPEVITDLNPFQRDEDGFGVFSVDKRNPSRMAASVLGSNIVQMVISTDSGTTWSNLNSLDAAMTGHGTYKYVNSFGPTDFTGFGGYAQPTLVAFSPFYTDTLVAAGADSGVFLSRDSGVTWSVITDNSGTTSNPIVPRAKFASFDRGGGNLSVFLGTQGRGVWKLDYPDPVAICEKSCADNLASCRKGNASLIKRCKDKCGNGYEECMADADTPQMRAGCGHRYSNCVTSCNEADSGNCVPMFESCLKRCEANWPWFAFWLTGRKVMAVIQT